MASVLQRTLSALPAWAKAFLRRTRSFIWGIAYRGEGRYCPVCGRSARCFRADGVIPREDALCVHCGALERHRLLWLFIQRKTSLLADSSLKMLHVAPEPCYEPRFRKALGDNYLTADLLQSEVMVKMDICDIEYPDESFDVICCSHVLEHVPNDRKAMRELHRVLRCDGWAVLNVPVTSEQTFEDPSITDPQERLRQFGQEDHVRRYGPDYADRLREAGFTVQVTHVRDLANDEEAELMGLTAASGEVHFCTKG